MDNELKIPRHIAIIMDGNGRWAKKRHRPRTYGHAKGAKVLEQILEDADDLGVKYFTVYAFSTENWARPYEEVKVIMNLFREYLVSSLAKCMKNNVRARIIGDRTKLSPDIIDAIRNLEETTKNNTGISFQIAMNYGSRDEIIRAVRKLVREEREGKIDASEISEEMLEQYLDTADIPDPDLLIRTSGEERLSNFLMWQLAYAEFYFTDVLWPDFNKEELIKAIEKYSSRDRRYGKLK
ncbi:MAG: isoprenyl transferase [Parasporobacterium sp.]|nr:isoprenyl transferase [Parasporobacterium sp.]